ncbi:MAG: beta-lactamase family protein [Candidatus Lokiarchaeota archaeon]|nr:beta-lactamase family protein [Candidatus Lokiarchaeota archaeon]
MKIDGYCDERFISVKQAFEKNFKLGLEVGASFAVSLNGELVVDIWGGFSDSAKTKIWEKDSIVNVFSTTKIMTALCIHLLIDRGLIDVDAPVAKYWPEFAQAGKENVLIKHLMSHSAGLPGFDEKIPIEALYDWDRITGLLASQKPWWKSGTKIGYHMITFGYLLGELVRRVTRKSLGEFFRDEIAVPFNIDFHIGLSESYDSRVASIITPEEVFSKWLIILAKLIFKKAVKVYYNPNLENTDFNDRGWRSAEIPASNGHGNARSIAQVGSILACGGMFDKKMILKLSTVEKAIEPQISGRDVVMMYAPAKFGLGFGLLNDDLLLGPRSFYWSGAGGSLCIMDLEKKLSIGYAMNKMYMKGKDPRTGKLIKAVWDSINSE